MQKSILIIVANCFALACHTTQASIHTFVATVAIVAIPDTDPLGNFPGIAIGDAFTSTVVLDASVPSSAIKGGGRSYFQDFITNALLSASVTVHRAGGDITYGAPISADVRVLNLETDKFSVLSVDSGIVPNNSPGYSNELVAVFLVDSTGLTFDSDAIPTILNLGSFIEAGMRIRYFEDSSKVSTFGIAGEITAISATSASAPLPTSILIWSGLALAGQRMRRGRPRRDR